MKPLRTLLAPVPAFLAFCAVMLYSALRWTATRLLIPFNVVALSIVALRSGDYLLLALMTLAAIQWLRSERERKLIEKGGGRI